MGRWRLRALKAMQHRRLGREEMQLREAWNWLDKNLYQLLKPWP
jgi:hypothetical protein